MDFMRFDFEPKSLPDSPSPPQLQTRQATPNEDSRMTQNCRTFDEYSMARRFASRYRRFMHDLSSHDSALEVLSKSSDCV
jgi:hypothetical protein